MNSQPLDKKSSILAIEPAIELNSSKASAGKALSLSRWCTALLYIYHFSSVIDFSSEKYIGSTGNSYSYYQQRRYSEVADGETRTRNLSIRN